MDTNQLQILSPPQEENPSPPPQKKPHGNKGKKHPEASKRYKEHPLRIGYTDPKNLMKIREGSRMGGSSHYSDSEKASALLALAANNWYVKKTAKETGVPEQTLVAWKSGKWVPERVREMVGMKVRKYRDKIEVALHKAMNRLIDQLDETDPKETLSALEIIFDQRQVLDNKPNTIIRTQGDNIPDEEFWLRLNKIARKYQESLSPDDTGGQGGVQQITLDVTSQASVGTVPEQPSGTSIQQQSE